MPSATTSRKKTAAKRAAVKQPSASTHVPRPKPPRTAREQAAISRAFERVRKLCLGYPGVYEKEAWSEATFRVEKGKMFLMFADNHHDDGRVAFWCMATPDAREAWLALDEERFFVPPYVGPSGWIGMRIDGDVPWEVAEEILAEGVRLASPKPGKTR